MKKIILMPGLFLLLVANMAFAQVKKGDQVPDFTFDGVLNAPLNNTSLSALKGKWVWLEFWATWCGPCISAMPQLEKLQARYKEQLQIVTVSSEGRERILQFIKASPFQLWFALDTANRLKSLFPYQMIPHSILISPKGELLAATLPENITANVIDSLLAGKRVHLPEKKDIPINTIREYVDQYFYAADTVQQRFVVQPELKGAIGMMTPHRDNPAFNGRRLTFSNAALVNIYGEAFGGFDYDRIINQIQIDKDKSFCLDIIVKPGEDLRAALRKELASTFAIHAEKVLRSKEVYVLKIADPGKFKTIPRHRDGQGEGGMRHGSIDVTVIDMKEFADYLENYGGFKYLVIDETANTEKLDIRFDFRPEDPDSLTKVLTAMGLRLEKAQREVEMLLLADRPL